MNYEIIGIIATLIVLLSFSFNSEKKIRIVNSIGSVLFVVYGLLIGALSVWLLNACVFTLNVYKLIKNKRK